MDHAVWLVVTYAGVVVAMGADLLTGVRKARRLGRRRDSRGYKRTCDKAMRYFLPMICLSCIDVLATVIFPAPYLTMVFGAYCIFCELKSILESTSVKADIARSEELERLLADEKELIANVVKALAAKAFDRPGKEDGR